MRWLRRWLRRKAPSRRLFDEQPPRREEWTDGDRGALAGWLATPVGAKFLRRLEMDLFCYVMQTNPQGDRDDGIRQGYALVLEAIRNMGDE